MTRKTLLACLLPALLLAAPARAQSLDELLDQIEEPRTELVRATFKSPRVVSAQSVESPARQDLLMVIGHRFGPVNSGLQELFGIDQATMRMGFDYGLGDRLAVGVGRSSFQKTYDGFVKYRILWQSQGERNIPVSLSWHSAAAVLTSTRLYNRDDLELVSRMRYAHQLLVARKFGPRLSLQLMPSVAHSNLTLTADEPNDIFALGTGGRLKLSNRVTLNWEYYPRLNDRGREGRHDALSLGFDIETGGHVFQLHLTNTLSMAEPSLIGQTTGSWLDGDIHFGFNINRTFALGKGR